MKTLGLPVRRGASSTTGRLNLENEMCDSGGGDEKRRYFFGPFEDPTCGPKALMTLESAIMDLRERFEDGEIGDELTYRLVELTDAEVEKLSDL
jgi:hypothetical protein